MCGIVGIWSPRGREPWDDAIHEGRRAADALAHRGPDDSGVWGEPDAGLVLGHRRLAVVDLSPAGAQPMLSADGAHVVAYNGEVYNAADLRAALDREAGVAWRGHSDTEVLVEALSRWGLHETLVRIRGMFAFAWWNRANRTLVLARDRLGEKPLYWGWHGGRFLFASEPRAFAATRGWQPAPDPAACAALLRYGFVPAPASGFAGISVLPAGHALTLSLDDARRDTQPTPVAWWSLPDEIAAARRTPLRGGPQDWEDALDGVLRQAVRRQTVADVPVGAFLSGGVDSSVVVAMLQQVSGHPVRSITIGFDDRASDESPEAARVAAHLGTSHDTVRISGADARAMVPRLPAMYGVPFADASQVATALVAAAARRSVTVALTGDGGDELFGGYPRYRTASAAWRHLALRPLAVRRAMAIALRAAASVPAWTTAFASPARDHAGQLRRLAAALDEGHVGALAQALRTFGPIAKRSAQQSAASDVLSRRHEWAEHLEPAEALMAIDAMSYLADDVLVKVDRAAMAVGLETRVPLLDADVVALAWSLPLEARVGPTHGKVLLRRVLARYVPPALTERPKRGFEIPVAAWIRGPLKEWAGDLLFATPSPLVPDALVRTVWDDVQRGATAQATWLWHATMLRAWLAQLHTRG